MENTGNQPRRFCKSFCRECDNLISGICRVCGCFVEMRTVMKKNSCPGISKEW